MTWHVFSVWLKVPNALGGRESWQVFNGHVWKDSSIIKNIKWGPEPPTILFHQKNRESGHHRTGERGAGGQGKMLVSFTVINIL